MHLKRAPINFKADRLISEPTRLKKLGSEVIVNTSREELARDSIRALVLPVSTGGSDDDVVNGE